MLLYKWVSVHGLLTLEIDKYFYSFSDENYGSCILKICAEFLAP